MAEIRRVAETEPGLAEAWTETAISPVMKVIAERFERLAIKDKKVWFTNNIHVQFMQQIAVYLLYTLILHFINILSGNFNGTCI